jgi:hypothetical protein
MPESPYSYCREPGCAIRTRSAYCPAHLNNNEAQRRRAALDYERKKDDPVWKKYNCQAWVRFKASFFSCNPICQRLIDGKQCCARATLIHHILSPRVRPDLMYTFGNCRALCAAHHETTEGERVENLDRLDQVYTRPKVPTLKF